MLEFHQEAPTRPLNLILRSKRSLLRRKGLFPFSLYKMKTRSRVLIIIAALLLSATYFFPLWEIDLQAPQYPEGLGLEIWLNEITGAHDYDLQKVNNLNHYIGMKAIHPESIPELKIMPWVMRTLMVFGIIVGIKGKGSWLNILLIIFLIVAIVGFVDYYLWGYDYGHNLDVENAIIKIPGQSYQPPLIGSKMILNFKAVSLPGIGGWSAIFTFLIWLSTAVIEHKRTRV